VVVCFLNLEIAYAEPGVKDVSLRKGSETLLVIFDGNDPGGYDAYHDVSFTDGVLRKEIIERTQPTFAVDAESLEEAMQVIESLGIARGSLDRIAIVDHGDVDKDPPIQTLGDERLKPRDFKKFRELLKPEGDICLYGCKVGKNVRYLKKISRYLQGRKVWAYAGVLSYDREDPSPLADPDSSLFFYYPMTE